MQAGMLYTFYCHDLHRKTCAGTIPVFFDKHLYHTMPYADILPWDQISVMIDFEWLEASKLNALDVLNERFKLKDALEMARKVGSIHLQ